MKLASLRLRLVLLVGVAVVPALLVMGSTLRRERAALREAAEESALHATRNAAHAHTQAITEASTLLMALAATPEVRVSDGPEACQELLAGIMERHGAFANLGVIALDGRVTCSALPVDGSMWLGDRAYFRNAIASGAAAVGDYQLGRITRKPTINVGMPIHGADDQVVGVVFAAIDLVALSVQVGEETGIPGATVTVQDADGIVLAWYPEPERWLGTSLAAYPMFAGMRVSPGGTVTGAGPDGVRRLYAFTPLEGDSHLAYLAIGIPYGEAFARSAQNFRSGTLLLFVISGVALVVAWGGAELLLARRVRRLSEASARLTTGDLSARSELPHGSDEIGRLAKDFDEMAASLDALTRRNRLILESAAEGILAVGLDGRVGSANPAATQLLGLPVDRIVGEPLHALVHGIWSDDHAAEDCPLVDPACSTPGRDDLFSHADGSAIAVQVACSPIREGNRVTGTVVFFADMREKRRLEEQLRQAQKMEAVGRLAGGVAHDFNNLLTAILGYGELLRAKLGPWSPHQHDLSEVLKAAHRAAALTRQLLAFSRRQVLSPRVLDVNRILTGLESMLRRLIGEDITLTLTLSPRATHMLADPGQLEQVIMNLVVNARDAMPTGGRLTLSTEALDSAEAVARGLAEREWVVLTVADTGVGMDEATLAHVFEPFFTTKPTGTGLGLSMVYGIVAQSGGDVQVESARGEGARFQLAFPRSEAEPTEDTETGGDLPSSGAETILLVEDDPSVRVLTRRTLEEAGYTVLEAVDVDDAFAIATRPAGGDIDLLLTDMIMPKRSGRALADQILERRAGLRVLYVSGYTADELGPHELGGAGLLAKPFTPLALLRRVREVLDTPTEVPPNV